MFVELDQTLRSKQAHLGLYDFCASQPRSPVEADTVLADQWLKACVDFGKNGKIAFKAMYDSRTKQIVTGCVLWYCVRNDDSVVITNPSNIVQLRFNASLASGISYEQRWEFSGQLAEHVELVVSVLRASNAKLQPA
jgi:hypothetical protein